MRRWNTCRWTLANSFMTVRDVESDLSPFQAIAAFSAPSGQFHAHRCKAAKLVAQTKKCSLRVNRYRNAMSALRPFIPHYRIWCPATINLCSKIGLFRAFLFPQKPSGKRWGNILIGEGQRASSGTMSSKDRRRAEAWIGAGLVRPAQALSWSTRHLRLCTGPAASPRVAATVSQTMTAGPPDSSITPAPGCA